MEKTNKSMPVKFIFKHLPDYANFLMDNKLKEFSLDLLNIAAEEKSSSFQNMHTLPEQERLELTLKHTKKLLECITINHADRFIKLRSKTWIGNKTCDIQTPQTIARNITNIAFIFRKAFRNFISSYTSEFSIAINLMNELDQFITQLEEISINSVFFSNQKPLSESYILESGTFPVSSGIGIPKEKKTEAELEKRRKQLTQKNIKLEKINTELASFSYVASHDLKEPLRKIKTYSNLLIEKHSENLTSEGKDYIERIINSAGNMQKLIDDLLSFSRTASAERKLKILDLNVLLEEVVNSLKETIEENKVTIISGQLPVLKVIDFQFRQLLENIIGNAIKYGKPGVKPNITITYGIVSGKEYANEGASPGRNYHKILFADNGIGFEQEYATKIFEIFQRLHGKNEYSGTGIGLAICKRIMENHKGFITAHSKLGEGSVFNVFFPVRTSKNELGSEGKNIQN